jgi:hypothetical protein
MIRNKHGIVFAELLTAIVLVGGIFTVTATLIVMSAGEVGAANDFLIARQIASSRLETIRARPFDEIRTADAEPFDSPLGDQLRGFSGTVRVEPFQGDADLKQITVTVRWQHKQRTRELSLSLLKGRRTP